MKSILKRIGLIENLALELKIGKLQFIGAMKLHIDEPGFDPFEIFSISKNRYKGKVNGNGFELKRKRRMFDMNMHLPTAKGILSEQNDKLLVEVEINSFHYMYIPFLILMILLYLFVIASIFINGSNGDIQGWAIPFILFHMCFMFGIPYLIMRRGVRNLKYDLERDIYFMVKDTIPSN